MIFFTEWEIKRTLLKHITYTGTDEGGVLVVELFTFQETKILE